MTSCKWKPFNDYNAWGPRMRSLECNAGERLGELLFKILVVSVIVSYSQTKF